MKSETTASTEIPQPAIAIPVWPVGTNRDASPRARAARVELERDGHLPDRAVRADGEDGLRRQLEVRAGRDVQAGRRLAQIAQLDAVPRGERGELLVVGRRTRAGRSRRPGRLAMQLLSSSRHAGGNRPPCVATPTSAVVGLEARARRRPSRRPGSRCSVSPARRESRSATTPLAVARARRGPSSRSAGRPEYPSARMQQPTRRLDTETRPFGGELDAVDERDSGPRIVRRAAGCRRGRRGRRGARLRSRRRSRAPTRSCTRASRRARARARRAPSAPPRGSRPTSPA